MTFQKCQLQKTRIETHISYTHISHTHISNHFQKSWKLTAIKKQKNLDFGCQLNIFRHLCNLIRYLSSVFLYVFFICHTIDSIWKNIFITLLQIFKVRIKGLKSREGTADSVGGRVNLINCSMLLTFETKLNAEIQLTTRFD